MSKAYQCDRCKRCFSIDDISEGRHIIKFTSMMKQNKNDILNSTFTDYKADLHFCPKCSRQFERFMESYIFINNPYSAGTVEKE